MDLTLVVWRQKNREDAGRFVRYEAKGISPHMSFLEMLDVVNADIATAGGEPIAFDHDCREGICGTCSQMVNGHPHGPQKATTVCQLHMRHFRDGDTVCIEPWRARAFPVIKDLIVDRSAFDRIIEAGGYISVDTGEAPEANSTRIGKDDVEEAMDAAECIACGACVAGCPNASAMLYVGAKVSHLAKVSQGRMEARQRVRGMVRAMDFHGFGNCSNHYECQAVCPKEIHVRHIARMYREYMKSLLAFRVGRSRGRKA